MSTIEGQVFCDARDQIALRTRPHQPVWCVPCEVARGGCGAAKGDPCKPAAQPSAPEPPPWTGQDEKHGGAGFLRLCELAVERRHAGDSIGSLKLAESAGRSRGRGESMFRAALHEAGFDPARIDAEVRLVRQRAERPAPVADPVITREQAQILLGAIVDGEWAEMWGERCDVADLLDLAASCDRDAAIEEDAGLRHRMEHESGALRLVADLIGHGPASAAHGAEEPPPPIEPGWWLGEEHRDAALASEPAAPSAPAWTPPPGVHPTVLHGSLDGSLLVALVTLDPGAEVPLEVHAEHEETIVSLAGDIVLETCGIRFSMGPGSNGYTVERQDGHTIRNASATEPAQYLSVLRRVSAEERCGACAEVRYTGVTTNQHSCRDPEPVEMTASPVSDTTPAPVPQVELTDSPGVVVGGEGA
jgi:quercetin dioxygenase-like cupin family protein